MRAIEFVKNKMEEIIKVSKDIKIVDYKGKPTIVNSENKGLNVVDKKYSVITITNHKVNSYVLKEVDKPKSGKIYFIPFHITSNLKDQTIDSFYINTESRIFVHWKTAALGHDIEHVTKAGKIYEVIRVP